MQLSLSTLLPSPSPPIFGSVPPLSGNFSRALAEAPDLAAALPGTAGDRQGVAAGGSFLPGVGDPPEGDRATARGRSSTTDLIPADTKDTGATVSDIPSGAGSAEQTASSSAPSAIIPSSDLRLQLDAPIVAKSDDESGGDQAPIPSARKKTHSPPAMPAFAWFGQDNIPAIPVAAPDTAASASAVTVSAAAAQSAPPSNASRAKASTDSLSVSDAGKAGKIATSGIPDAPTLGVTDPALVASSGRQTPTMSVPTAPSGATEVAPILVTERVSTALPIVIAAPSLRGIANGVAAATTAPATVASATDGAIVSAPPASSAAVLTVLPSPNAQSIQSVVAAGQSPVPASSGEIASAVPDDGMTSKANRIQAATLAATQTTPQVAARSSNPAAPVPAVIAFSTALATAFADRQAAASKPQTDDAQLITALAVSAAHTQQVAGLAMGGDASGSALDMRRDDWPQAMIDRIDALRDSANANDTSIRLMPDALGKIDVSLRHEGDAVHVQFAAAVPATQALLATAQPQLAQLAQARGLRLAQGSVDPGSSGGGQQQRGALPQPTQSTRPASVVTTVAADAGADSRLA